MRQPVTLQKPYSLCRCSVILFILLGLLAGVNPTAAQNAYAIRINWVQPVEDTDALMLNTYFTLYDTVTGDVVTNARVNKAEIIFVDTQQKADAAVLQPNTPFYIALVLDTSGSMAGAAAAMRSAAVEAVKSPPEGARFAVMTFNDKFDVLQNFLDIKNTDPLERAIAKVQPVPNAATCLYDAAYSAIAELEQAPAGRRALILFTDGKDETRKPGEPCSKHKYEDIIQYATRPDISVPISTIGMAGKQNAINSEELKNMATTTGGFSVIGTQQNLSELFETIMDALKSQLLAQARLYPVKGTHNVLLKISLDDGSIISESLTFVANKNYTVPAAPANLALAGINYKPELGGYQLDLNVTSPQLIQSLSVSVWDTKSGLKMLENEYQNIQARASFTFPAEIFTNGGDYELRLNLVGTDGQPILNAEGKTPFLTHPFKHSRSSSLTIETITIAERDLLAKLDVQNSQEISQYKAWLVDDATKVQVKDSDFTTKTLENGSLLRVPMKEIPAGKYTLVIVAQDGGGKTLATIDYADISYTPPKGLGLFATVFNALMKNTLILGAVVLILLVIVFWLVISSIRSRSMTGTPILQANLPASMRSAGALPLNQTQVVSKKEIQAMAANRQATIGAPVSAPVAVLRIIESTDPAWTGKICPIAHLPFSIGRQGCDLTIEKDLSISHTHAKITYDERQRVYMITDISRNGILLAGVRIARETPVRLPSGAVIGIGPKTTAIFEVNPPR